MPSSVLAITGLATTPPDWRGAEVVLSWDGPNRNLRRALHGFYPLLPRAPSPRAADLLDIATVVYGADLGVPRGRNEDWVRHIRVLLAVREPNFWQARADDLSYLLYVLTRDSFTFRFAPRNPEAADEPAGADAFAGDAVCLLSGGLDSLAGALMLLRTGRRPLLLCHQSGNPAVLAAQRHVAQLLAEAGPGQAALAGVRLQAEGSSESFPAAVERESSQRARGFLFLALALAAAEALGVAEAYVAENGILTLALPLSGARVGGLSTRSTHPQVIALMNELAHQCGLTGVLTNPFLYQTKAEIIRDLLRPAWSPFDSQRTVSCWATGRSSRQCGGCVACLVRRLAMLAAGLPDEAYELNVLGDPDSARGTDAYANLVDLLGLCTDFLTQSDSTLLARSPELLDAAACGVSLREALSLYRRFGREVRHVVHGHFPAAAKLMP